MPENLIQNGVTAALLVGTLLLAMWIKGLVMGKKG
jgi:hypothetical protein